MCVVPVPIRLLYGDRAVAREFPREWRDELASSFEDGDVNWESCHNQVMDRVVVHPVKTFGGISRVPISVIFGR